MIKWAAMKIYLSRLVLMVAAGLTPVYGGVQAYGYGYQHNHGFHHEYGYHGGYGQHGYSHHGSHLGLHGHAEGELAVGLLAGALIAYAITSRQTLSHRQPGAPSATLIAPHQAEMDHSCLQQREYHTTIIIDGEEVRAWGVACLQPNGAWQRRGLNLKL